MITAPTHHVCLDEHGIAYIAGTSMKISMMVHVGEFVQWLKS